MAINHGGIAAGFLHALRTPEVYQAWQKIDTSDPKAVGAFVQATLGLAQAPSASELKTMAAYADQHLAAEHSQIQALHKDAPHTCGEIYLSQQQ